MTQRLRAALLASREAISRSDEAISRTKDIVRDLQETTARSLQVIDSTRHLLADETTGSSKPE